MVKGLVGPSVIGTAIVAITVSMRAAAPASMSGPPVTRTARGYVNGDGDLEHHTLTDVDESGLGA